jgi:hypothetical protein
VVNNPCFAIESPSTLSAPRFLALSGSTEDPRSVCTAPSGPAAADRFDEFAVTGAAQGPGDGHAVACGMGGFIPFLDHDVEVRHFLRAIAIESQKALCRRAVRGLRASDAQLSMPLLLAHHAVVVTVLVPDVLDIPALVVRAVAGCLGGLARARVRIGPRLVRHPPATLRLE